MEKGADAQTLSMEIFEICGNIWILKDYSPLFSEESLHIVKMITSTIILKWREVFFGNLDC